MRYLLSNSCKENLVASPLDWPGASSAESLISGEPMTGRHPHWTAFKAAQKSGKKVSIEDFSDEVSLELQPLPAYRHLAAAEYRRLMLDLVREVELETAERHRSEGTRPLGTEAILRQDPRFEPKEKERTPRKWFHTDSPQVLKELREALVWIFACYRQAADRLKAGQVDVEFPLHTFPPGLSFVRPKIPI